jgi:hypothetical protein
MVGVGQTEILAIKAKHGCSKAKTVAKPAAHAPGLQQRFAAAAIEPLPAV